MKISSNWSYLLISSNWSYLLISSKWSYLLISSKWSCLLISSKWSYLLISSKWSYLLISSNWSYLLLHCITDEYEVEMPPTVQEALAAEHHTRTEQLTSVIEQLKVEREGSQQAFDKYRLVCVRWHPLSLHSIFIWSFCLLDFLSVCSFVLLFVCFYCIQFWSKFLLLWCVTCTFDT